MALTAQERRVVEVLYADWRDLLRCTAIDQAMERAGMRFAHDARLRIADFILNDTEAGRLMRWAPPVYVLTNGEKLVARLILRRQREGRPTQPHDVAAQGFGAAAAAIEEAFDTLQWLSFLRKAPGGYRLAPDHARFLTGVGFYFHEVVLPGRKQRFNTNCAQDFFIMTHRPTYERALARMRAGQQLTGGEGMSPKMVAAIRDAAEGRIALALHDDERTVLNDACGWSDEPITITMDRGRLVELSPASSWYLQGGG